MNKSERIYAEAMGLIPREGYPILTEDHPFFGMLNVFMMNKTRWIGTASDLISDMEDHFTPPGTAAKLLRQYRRKLNENYGIKVSFSRTSRKRIIELQRISDRIVT